MARQKPRAEEEKNYTFNGSAEAHDKQESFNKFTETRFSRNTKEEFRGYGILAASVLIFLYAATGFLAAYVNPLLAILAIGTAFYGAKKANLFDQAQRFVTYLRNRF